MNTDKLKYYALVFVAFACIFASFSLEYHKETKHQALTEWYSAKHWHYMTVDHLYENLEYVKFVDRPDEHGRTALMIAVTSNPDPKIIKELIKIGANVKLKDNFGQYTALAHAIEDNASAEIVKLLLDAGSPIEEVRKNFNLLMLACQNDNAQVIDLLLQQHKIDINQQTADGYTALMFAAMNAKTIDVPQKLLDAGADINLYDKYKNTALLRALKENPDPDVRSFFIQNTPDLYFKDNSGWNAIDYALTIHPHDKVAKALINRNIDLAKNSYLLFRANTQGIKIMVRHGADVNARDTEGNTLLMNLCAPSTDFETIKFLLENGANVNAINNHGQNALLLAILRGVDTKVIRLLLKHGADIHASDNKGRTPLNSLYNLQNSQEIKQLFVPFISQKNETITK